ncbi:Uncharacterized protein dnm_063360 [Desulfonema magnum]|uniref:Uncharacterized protein n=1 Tax=Desulfonema magnum TaxID=45655 RepID=A0A975BRJ6_9BACT|nr:Uncharacterized protein dnm_063360 [Desulfonema magnum]
MKRTWQQVNLYCRSCNKEYPLEKFTDLMDEMFEEALANIPCNRL